MKTFDPRDLNNNPEADAKGAIVLYTAKGGETELEVRLEEETVWLTQKQIAELFGTQRPAITKHFSNIFRSGELGESSVSSILEHTAADGKVYKTKYYNLDAIISVGYRVNSQRATQFRIWASKVIKDYLVKGYAVNHKRLLEQTEKLKELQQAISFIQDKAGQPVLQDQAQELLKLINEYSQSLTLLHQYDEGEKSLAPEAIGRKKNLRQRARGPGPSCRDQQPKRKRRHDKDHHQLVEGLRTLPAY